MHCVPGGGDSSVVERRVSNRKIADPRFDSHTGSASFCTLKRHFTFIFYWGRALYPLWWTSLTKDLQTEPKKCSALVWLDRLRMPGSYERTNDCVPATPVLIVIPGTFTGAGHSTGWRRRLAAAACVSRDAKNLISSAEKLEIKT